MEKIYEKATKRLFTANFDLENKEILIQNTMTESERKYATIMLIRFFQRKHHRTKKKSKPKTDKNMQKEEGRLKNKSEELDIKTKFSATEKESH